jgi:two-component system, chemotaxis family, protein-glutamate methylesterase/glutaminase
VIGIILSGHLDDGSAGLRAVRSCGGIGIVQDPADASARQMPESALRYGGADYILPVTEIGPHVTDLINNCRSDAMHNKKPEAKSVENEGMENLNVSRPNEGHGVPSAFGCPDCGGVLWELQEGEMVRFRCRVGHGYTMATLAEAQEDGVEDALWAAMRALEEKAALSARLSESTNNHEARDRLREQAEADRKYAETVRKMLFSDGAKEATPSEPAA